MTTTLYTTYRLSVHFLNTPKKQDLDFKSTIAGRFFSHPTARLHTRDKYERIDHNSQGKSTLPRHNDTLTKIYQIV